MKRTTTINLGGIVFNIDEDAYQTLSNYLSQLERHFSEDEREEILKDIEVRMAELLKCKLQYRDVVEIADVNEVIDVIGHPEQFGEEKEEYKNDFENSDNSFSQNPNRKYRKLYRDPENKVIGGVASGIAAYFGMERVLMRVLFIVLILISFGWGLLIYLILLVAMPEAKTTAQLLEMRGIEPSLENINNFHTNSGDYIKSKSTAGNIIKFLLICLGIVIGTIFGICFLGCVIAIFVALITYTPGGFGDWIDIGLLSSVAVFCLCPVIGIIVLCVRAFRNQGRKHKWVGWTLLAIWIISLFAIIWFGITEGTQNELDEKIENNINQYGKNLGRTMGFYYNHTHNDNDFDAFDEFDEFDDDNYDFIYEEEDLGNNHSVLSYTYATNGRKLTHDEIDKTVDKIRDMYKDENVQMSVSANEKEGVQIKIYTGKEADKANTSTNVNGNKQNKNNKAKTASDTTKTTK